MGSGSAQRAYLGTRRGCSSSMSMRPAPGSWRWCSLPATPSRCCCTMAATAPVRGLNLGHFGAKLHRLDRDSSTWQVLQWC